MEIDKNIFDPSLLSFADCHFLLEHAGEQPAQVAYPPAVNRITMRQWIERFYELSELEKAGKGEWKGIQTVKDAIKLYLEQREMWKKEEQYGAPKFPSLYAFDSRGNAHLSAPGSDSGRVKSYFDKYGNRVPFAVNIVEDAQTGKWKPSWVRKAKEAVTEIPQEIIKEPEGENCVKCGVPGCGHTETFKPESRSSYNAARARLSKHMRKAQFEPEVHLEYYSLEFGSSDK
jgi:hypothetical protein